jgi:ubiquinone biosynthesis protein UbiJ
MADDIVMQILQAIQADLADLGRKVTDLDGKVIGLVSGLDRKVSDQGRTLNIVKQDVRMIRSTIHDMGKTRVTEGEIVTLHEDVDRMQETVAELVGRVEALEGQRPG